jgi:hypothetical protein
MKSIKQDNNPGYPRNEAYSGDQSDAQSHLLSPLNIYLNVIEIQMVIIYISVYISVDSEIKRVWACRQACQIENFDRRKIEEGTLKSGLNTG